MLELNGPMLQNVDILWQTNMPMPESGTVVLDLKAGSRRHLLDAAQLGNINNPYRDPQTLNVLAARQTVLTWAQDTASLARWQGVSAKDLNTYLDFNYNTQLDKTLNESSYREGAVLLHRGTAQPLELMDMDHQELYYAEFSSWEFVVADGPRTYVRVRGARVYEQSNHLGNVLTTLSDKVLGRLPDNAYVCSHYESIVVSATDYFPFGWEMPGRSVNKAGYRFGFNGKEADNAYGSGSYDFGARIHDGRIGRWLSVDPLAHKYPSFSTYCSSLNNPLYFIDPDGADVIGLDELFSVAKRAVPILKNGSTTFNRIVNGFEPGGAFEKLNLVFSSAKLKPEKGVMIFAKTSISVLLKNGQVTALEDFTGNFDEVAKMQISVFFNDLQDDPTAVVSMVHEVGTHVETYAPLVLEASENEDKFNQFRNSWIEKAEQIKANPTGYESPDHDAIASGTATTYNAIHSEVKTYLLGSGESQFNLPEYGHGKISQMPSNDNYKNKYGAEGEKTVMFAQKFPQKFEQYERPYYTHEVIDNLKNREQEQYKLNNGN